MPFATRNFSGSSRGHLRRSRAIITFPARSWASRLYVPAGSILSSDGHRHRGSDRVMEGSAQNVCGMRYFHNVLIYQKFTRSDNPFIMILIRLIDRWERRALCQIPRGHFIRARWHRLGSPIGSNPSDFSRILASALDSLCSLYPVGK